VAGGAASVMRLVPTERKSLSVSSERARLRPQGVVPSGEAPVRSDGIEASRMRRDELQSSYAAIRWYSWMSPPRMSRHSMSVNGSAVMAAACGEAGLAGSIPRCGRCSL
jgi:hypothetical protein